MQKNIQAYKLKIKLQNSPDIFELLIYSVRNLRNDKTYRL